MQDEVGDLQSNVKEQVDRQLNTARDSVNQQMGRAGSIRLNLPQPLMVGACYAQFLQFQDGRPSVLQLQSYRDPDTESFPSVFLRAITPAGSLAETSGATLEATLFVQREPAGPVLFSSAPIQILAPFQSLAALIDRNMTAARRRDGAARLAARCDSMMPDYASLVSDAGRVAEELERGETARWQATALPAPELLAAILQRWRELHVATLRCRAVCWALDDLVGEEGLRTRALQTGPEVFSQQIVDAIARLIETEARRREGGENPAEVARVYAECARVLAETVSRADNEVLRERMTDSLDKLAKSSFLLSEDVRAYRQATSELLRWRRRVVARQAQSRAAEYPDLRLRFPVATRSTSELRGLFPQAGASGGQAQLEGTAPEAVKLAAANLGGGKFSLDGVNSEGDYGIADFRHRTYASFPLGPLKTAIVASSQSLRRELLIDDDHPALTLQAAEALAVTSRGDLELVGGQVHGLHLEALVTRQAQLPAVGWVLVPLGTLPPDFVRSAEGTDVSATALEQMQMRFDLRPTWGHNGYALVDLTAPSGQRP